MIMQDDRADTPDSQSEEPIDPEHPLLYHPLASSLMEAVEAWIHDESLGQDGLAALNQVHTLAKQMLQSPPTQPAA